MNEVEHFLQKHKTAFERHEYDAVFTCEEADKIRGDIKGVASKKFVFTK